MELTKTISNQTCNQKYIKKIYALIRITPAITDPRELQTIITTSLRSLFGDCESHSVVLNVLTCRPVRQLSEARLCPTNTNDSNNYVTAMTYGAHEAIIECPATSLDFVRAALTFPMLPSYFNNNHTFRFDFIRSADSVSALDN